MAQKSEKRDAMRLRRAEVATLSLRGVTYAEMAVRLQVGRTTISSDLRAIRKEWLESRVRDFDQAREMELRKLDNLEREAWEAWSRSQRPTETNKVSGGGLDLTERRRGEKISQSRTGDAKYLDVVARCIDKRCEILGICTLPRGDTTVIVQTTEIRQALLMDDNFLEYCRHRACHGDAGHVRLLDLPAPLVDVSSLAAAGPGADGLVPG